MNKFMKKILIIITLACVGMFYSCKDKVEIPSGGFAWFDEGDILQKSNPSPTTVNVGQALLFVSTANDADVYTVWPGELGYDYTKRLLNDTLLDDTVNVVNKKNQGLALSLRSGEFRSQSYKYTKIGENTIYFVSRNITDGGREYKEVVDSAKITVIDTVAALFVPSGEDAGTYRFLPLAPAGAEYEESGSTVTLFVSHSDDLSEVSIVIKAGRCEVTVDQGTVAETSAGTLWTGSLETDRTITVTSASGYTNTYTLTAEKGTAPTPSSEKEMLSFSVNGYTAEISGTSVNLEVPTALDITDVKPVFTLSDNAEVSVGGVEQTSNSTSVDLSAILTYTVKAADGSTVDYTVTTTTVDTKMTAFAFSNLNPVVKIDNIVGNTIDFTLFPGTDITTLIPSITMTKFAQASYTNGGQDVAIESGVTEIDFSAPVEISVYTDVDTVKYTVNVGF